MGVSAQEMRENGRKGSGSSKRRGSTDNASRLSAFAAKGVSSGADWGSCDARWLQAVVVAITKLGGAITIGLSRDSGAYSLTLLLDGDRQTLWFNGGVDLDAELETVYQTLETMR